MSGLDLGAAEMIGRRLRRVERHGRRDHGDGEGIAGRDVVGLLDGARSGMIVVIERCMIVVIGIVVRDSRGMHVDDRAGITNVQMRRRHQSAERNGPRGDDRHSATGRK